MSPTGILIRCTVPSEAVPFVYLASVCWSLQCLISALTQAGRGGLLFRLLVPSRCGEGLALLFPSTLLRLPAALYGACLVLRAVPALGSSTKVRNKKLRPRSFLPRPKQLRQPGACRAHSPRVRPAFSLRGSSLSPRPPESGACALCLAATLPADVAHPESQEVFG